MDGFIWFFLSAQFLGGLLGILAFPLVWGISKLLEARRRRRVERLLRGPRQAKMRQLRETRLG